MAENENEDENESTMTLNEGVMYTFTRIQKEGWVPRDSLIEELGLELYGRLEAFLLSSGHVTRVERGEPLRPGLEFTGRKLLKKDIPGIIRDLGLESFKEPKKQWGEFTPIRMRWTFTTKVLGGVPDARDPKSNKMFFRRDHEGKIVLLSGYFRGMLTSALQLADIKGFPRYGRDMIRFSNITLDGVEAVEERTIAPPNRALGPRAGGSGFRTHEALPEGTCIVVECIVPLSHIAIHDFLRVIEVAGRYVGFSPACSNQGWGRFTVEVIDAK